MGLGLDKYQGAGVGYSFSVGTEMHTEPHDPASPGGFVLNDADELDRRVLKDLAAAVEGNFTRRWFLFSLRVLKVGGEKPKRASFKTKSWSVFWLLMREH